MKQLCIISALVCMTCVLGSKHTVAQTVNEMLYAKGMMTLDCHQPEQTFEFLAQVFASESKRLGRADAENILRNYLRNNRTCETFTALRLKYPGKWDSIQIDIHVEKQERVLTSVAEQETLLYRQDANNALPEAFSYLRDVGISLPQESITYIHDIGYVGVISTPLTWNIKFVGQITSNFNLRAEWLINETQVVLSEGTLPFNNYGEAGQQVVLHLSEEDTLWEIKTFTDNPIIIDAHDVPRAEVFESIYLEIIHKAVSKHRIEKMMETLNLPENIARVDAHVADYLLYDEVAVHYIGICLMHELLKQGLYPGDTLTNYVKKFKDAAEYKGLVELLQKYPPSIKNAKFIAEVFMDDPRRIATL